MELINQNMLWGLLAISAPILIHFWNQKKAILVDWAAMKWLLENQKLKAKGFRFEDLLLLILRILAIVLLTFILTKPIIEKSLFSSNNPQTKIHIIEKNAEVFENFKYEINEALTKNEPIFWADDLGKNIKNLENTTEDKKIQLHDIQFIANYISQKYQKKELHLYLSNINDFNNYPNVFFSQNFKLHFQNSFPKDDNDGEEKSNSIDIEKIKKEIFNVAIKTKVPDEEKIIKAAFEAIAEVYSFNFKYDKTKKNKDISIGQLDNNESSNLMIQTGNKISNKNYYSLNESLDRNKSGLVYRAELPERILEIILKHYNLADFRTKVSQKQLDAIFRKKAKSINTSSTQLDKYLMFLFLITTIAERWISLKNNK